MTACCKIKISREDTRLLQAPDNGRKPQHRSVANSLTRQEKINSTIEKHDEQK
jgi:hypothetical protein